MTGITDPGEEYFKDGLWAWVSTAWKKLVADASNFLQINIAAQDIDVEVKQQTAADLTPGVMGWDGSAWKKLPMLWGYSAIYGEEIEDTSTDAATEQLKGSTVSSGQVWVVEAMQARNKDTDPSTITLQVFVNSQYLVFKQTATPGVAVWVTWTGHATLGPDDRAQADIAGCVNGDHIEFRVCGYKMKIGE